MPFSFSDLQARFFAAVYPRTIRAYEQEIAPIKDKIFHPIAGTVLEIGPGAGANLRFCENATQWVGVEPNPYMHRYLNANLQRFGVRGSIITEPAELIDLPAESFDVAIGTLVLCSVDDPGVVLKEVYRLLKPGGCYFFVEHVLEPHSRFQQRFQKWIRPLWKVCADGCRPDLDAARCLKESEFAEVALQEFHASPNVLPWFLTPHIAGSARKRS